MATPVALAMRREEAAGRSAPAARIIAAQLGITVDEEALSGRGRDSNIALTRQSEAIADLLEQVAMKIAPEDVPETATPLVIDGIEPKHIDALAAAGLTTLEQVRNASDEDLQKVRGIGPVTIKHIRAHLAGGSNAE